MKIIKEQKVLGKQFRFDSNLTIEMAEEFIILLLEKVKNLTQTEWESLYYNYSIEKSTTIPCVYFIKNKYTGLIKIGQTSDILKRIATLQSLFKSYFGVEDALKITGLICTFSQKQNKLEHEIHNELKQYRCYGEWFNISQDIVDTYVCPDLVLSDESDYFNIAYDADRPISEHTKLDMLLCDTQYLEEYKKYLIYGNSNLSILNFNHNNIELFEFYNWISIKESIEECYQKFRDFLQLHMLQAKVKFT